MARMALMTQSCACCWITVPQYGHRALAFTSSGETKRITCPGCGAPLDVNASARCPYCGTVIQQQAQDWVISAIRAIKQQTL